LNPRQSAVDHAREKKPRKRKPAGLKTVSIRRRELIQRRHHQL
jgi:hypothetical protein